MAPVETSPPSPLPSLHERRERLAVEESRGRQRSRWSCPAAYAAPYHRRIAFIAAAFHRRFGCLHHRTLVDATTTVRERKRSDETEPD